MTQSGRLRSHLTLALCTILHAFSHAYSSMLVPLYLKIVLDMKLGGVGAASFIVTVYGAAYCLGSYAAGVMADRFDRKILLGIGLIGNALTMLGMGLCRDYAGIVLLAAVAGSFGTLFHPAANALAPSHYPKSPGMAIGIMGAGSGLGFFFGPQFAGWRGASASWHFLQIAQWQKPVIELGILGLLVGIIFLFIGFDPGNPDGRTGHKVDPVTRKHVLQLACILMFRDFAGIAGISLASIYLLRVFHAGVAQAGLFVGLMMVPSILANPLSVYLSNGKRRLPALAMILVFGGCAIATTPLWHGAMVLGILCIYQTMQMTSYAISDAAMLERVSPEIRGRVVGLFLIIAGTFGAMGPFLMGRWTDWLGGRANMQTGYFGPFGALGICMIFASLSPVFIARLGGVTSTISPAEEIAPATLG